MTDYLPDWNLTPIKPEEGYAFRPLYEFLHELNLKLVQRKYQMFQPATGPTISREDFPWAVIGIEIVSPRDDEDFFRYSIFVRNKRSFLARLFRPQKDEVWCKNLTLEKLKPKLKKCIAECIFCSP